jgi:CBS-domain-containing membrane protein
MPVSMRDNKRCLSTLSINPINRPYQPISSTKSINHLYQPSLSTISVNNFCRKDRIQEGERTMYAGTVGTRQVETCSTQATILQVAELMRSEHVGDLVVVEYRNGNPIPVGIVTDRDLVVEVMAMKVRPESVTAGEIMSRKLVIAYEGEQLEVAMERMRGSGVRRVPLVDSAGVLVGIVTLDDIIGKLAATLADVSRVGHRQNMDERLRRS